jgi:hypothetical protein
VAQSDFWFASLKKLLKGINFTYDEAVPPATAKWFQEQPEEFYSDRFKELVHCWQHCITQRETMWKIEVGLLKQSTRMSYILCFVLF